MLRLRQVRYNFSGIQCFVRILTFSIFLRKIGLQYKGEWNVDLDFIKESTGLLNLFIESSYFMISSDQDNWLMCVV